LSKDLWSLWSWVFLACGLFPTRNVYNIGLQERKEQSSQNIHFQWINYKRGDLNLAGDQSCLIGGRWPSFLPNFSDNHLPHLSLGRGAAISKDRFHLGVNFAVPGWIHMIPFDGGGAFLPKRTLGATGENWKVEPSSFLGSGPSSCYRKRKWNKKRN
jgi:hypothetical protein